MLTTSRIISTLVQRYIASVPRDSGEYRLVVPGLTSAIGEQVHGALHQSGAKSFLVINQSRQPDAGKHWLLAPSLTNMRIGSFIAVPDPGTLADIMDSIRGTGGTIRSLALSEEWPWIDNGSEAFRFSGPFLDELIKGWEPADEEVRAWFRSFLREALLPATRQLADRAEVLLEEIIGTFDPASPGSLPGAQDRFLFHCGIPSPALASDTPGRIAEDIRSLVKGILERVRNDTDLRTQVLSRVHEETDVDANDLTAAVHAFFDGLATPASLDGNLLAFRGCWGGPAARLSNWSLLTVERLRRLFEVRDAAPVDVLARVKQASGVVTSPDGTSAAANLSTPVAIEVQYDIPASEFAASDCWLRVTARGVEVQPPAKLVAPAATVEVTCDLAALAVSYRNRIPVTVAISVDDVVRGQARVYLHACGDKRPAFVVTLPNFWVDDAEEGADEGAATNRHPVDGPVTLHLFSHDDVAPKVADDVSAEEHLPVGRGEPGGIWRTLGTIDPLASASGRITCSCELGSRSVAITYEVEEVARGEFTLEDELRRLVVAARADAVSDVLRIHDGITKEPYPRLGGITHESLNRVQLARAFEERMGWLPILVDLLRSGDRPIAACGDFARTAGIVTDTSVVSAVKIPEPGLTLLREYGEARDAFREAVCSTLEPTRSVAEHPDYAIYPFYVAEKAPAREAIESHLVAYLASYAKVQEFVRSQQGLTWEQLFVLCHVDCAVHWGGGSARGAFFLIGPWHPLTVAKRFMVQRALVLRGKRLVDAKDKALCHLAGLLGEIRGFSWHPCLSADDASTKAAYVTPTSDPGWHFAFNQQACQLRADSGDSPLVVGAALALRATLGLEVRVYLPSTTAMVRKVFNSYVRTFPSKRHVGVYFAPGFSGEEEIAQAHAFLHSDGQPTMAALQLPGGMDLSFAEEPVVPDDVTWSDPPLRVYRYPDRDACISAQHPNIQFCGAEDEIRFDEARGVLPLPRGIGYASAFSQPLSRLRHGSSFIPRSIAEEWEPTDDTGGDGIGAGFARACRLACLLAGKPMGIIRPISLPPALKAAWTVVPGTILDPAVFVRYVQDGHTRKLEDRALWDYCISVSQVSTSFFVLSTIPASFRSAIGGVFQSPDDLASQFVTELGQIGLAIGGEAMKSGRHARGTLGVVGAVRLLAGGAGQQGPLAWDASRIGFLLPVDSFQDLLGQPSQSEEDSANDRRRGDLLALMLWLPPSAGQPLRLQPIVVECKFSGTTLKEGYAHSALEQAKRTHGFFTKLCTAARSEDGIPERLALLQLVRFGLRASGGQEGEGEVRRAQEAAVYGAILAGNFELTPARVDAALVSTELKLPGKADIETSSAGTWVRLNGKHWPGVAETDSITEIRGKVAGLFPKPDGGQTSGGGATSQPTPSTPSEAAKESPKQLAAEPSPTETPVPAAESKPTPAAGQKEASGALTTPETTQGGVILRRLLVGADAASRRAVYFDPHSPVDRLDNANVMVTGSSGKGKTQFLKYLVTAIREQGANAMLLDFKNDFANDTQFIARARLASTLVTFDGLPFNPLIPYPVTDQRTGAKLILCAQHITGIAAVFKRTYALGVQQEAAVKNAIRQAFSDAGVNPNGNVAYNPETTFPDLAAVGEILAETNPAAYNRLDPLFTLDLFREQHWRTSFAQMVNQSMAIDLSQLPSDELKNALAELIVLSAHSFFNKQPHSGALRQVFVVDEAHRVLKADYVEKFTLECRAYGVGLFLSSQYPFQFPPGISASMSTKVIHGNDRDVDRVRDITNLLGCAGREAQVADMGMFEAMFSNKHHRNVGIRTMNYPAYIVWSALQAKGEMSRDEISRVDGLDTTKLSVGNIVAHLERLGLCEESGGVVRVLLREG